MPAPRPDSEESVANLALDECKEDEIATLDDDLARARVVRRHFAIERDATLARLDWNFAMAWARPAADTVASPGALAIRFPLPPDCIAVREVFSAPGVALLDDEWAVETSRVVLGGVEVEAKVLVTNCATPLVRYTRRVETVALWDPLFLKAFVKFLAGAIAPKLGKSSAMAQRFTSEAEALLLPIAKKADSKEKAPTKQGRTDQGYSWLMARRGFRMGR